MKKICLLALVAVLRAEEKADLYVINRIKAEAFQNSKVMENAYYLTDVYGPRLTGSPHIKAAAEWAVRRMTGWGLSNAKLEKWEPFGRGWSCIRFSAHLTEPQYATLIGVVRPWSPGTNGPIAGTPMLAPIRTEADFEKFKGKLTGKIVLLQEPRPLMPQSESATKRFSDAELAVEALAPDPSASSPFARPIPGPPMPELPGRQPGQPYNREAMQKFRNKLNKFLVDEGVLLTLVPSYRTDGGTVFANAAGPWDTKYALPPPSVALTSEHYNRIARLLEKKTPVTVEFDIQNRFYDNAEAFNVTAELPGGAKRDQIVMLGGHLDSWTFGTGATDNAAGCAVVLEAVRILKTLDLKMPRTVRIALWSGEEQGSLGSKAYVKEHFADRETMKLKPEHAKLSGYFNLDNGTGKIRGAYLQGNDMMRPIFENWLAPFKDLGVSVVTIRNTGGTDHLSFDAVGLPGFQFVQDPVEYSTRTHHSNMDVYDRLQAGDLMQASAIIASVIYHAAVREEMLPRKPLPKPAPRKKTEEEDKEKEQKVPSASGDSFKSDTEFTRAGDISLTLDAHIPDGPGPFPAAIVVHGGGFIRGDKQTYVKPLFGPLTRSGFAWFTINYRLAPAHRFPAAVEDVEQAVRFVKTNAKQYKVDERRIALIGESAGGHLVSFVGVQNRPDARVAAVVSFYGPHDLESRAVAQNKISDSVQAFLGVAELNPETRRRLREASPISYVSREMPPFLLIHGTEDPVVPHEQSVAMCGAMKKAGATCEIFSVPGAPHGIGSWEKNPAWQEYKDKMVDWLKTALKTETISSRQ